MAGMRIKAISSIVALVALVGLVTPSGAQEETGAPQSGAKGLFLEQLDKPEKSLNTGLQYWINLNRDGKTMKVTNKFNFKTGDRIKFHVKSNINGFAYIILKSGSRGEQSVLFPDRSNNEDNHVVRGKEYILPNEGCLTFDENPGLEKVSLVLSRTPLDAKAYLNHSDAAPTLIASTSSGSKDLIPQRVLVSFPDNRKEPDVPLTTRNKVVAKQEVPKKKKTKSPTNKVGTKEEADVVTVVSSLPENVLHIDVDLHHN